MNSKLWDAPVRIVHWALVVLMAFSWWTHPDHMDWHRLSGYAILGLVVFRILWGFVGSSNARFASFLAGPRATLAYARQLPARTYAPAPGHNPLGGWSVIAILLTLAGQVITGLFAVDVDGLESGPLSDRVEFDTGRWFAEWHEVFFTIIQVLVALHVVAVLFYLLYKRTNLIRAMLTGRAVFDRDPGIHFAGPIRILAVAVFAVVVAWAASKGFHFG